MAEEVAREVKRIAAELKLPFVFKASYAKANRSAGESYRGPGVREGLRELRKIRESVGVPVTSDVHETSEVEEAAEVLDLIQVPAFLCRQTALVEAVARTGKPVHLKKGQFLAPASMERVVDKARNAGASGIIVTERGTMFGYGDLVVDFRGIEIMKGFGCPVFFDATHSVQRPGGRETGGQREFIPVLGRAAVAAGVDGIFIETHPDPARARSDRESQWPLSELRSLLSSWIKIRQSLADESLVGARPA
ncbi:MAG: 3-deoxy-8-phosphooctulonate synthase [Candidatus Eisenbacteria bacterium]|uniref:3-deoxy-8-phosphooctulonate synthase n=1 Tax=Eiseniibacteriota bacterium TaxID=2212470 RepID=A0A538SBT9_UNCEI|nr:MAG: 3-deoxy-8-phosphooctulonate synthase [Candidatus Eisenbacteria bacterium]TMQ57647.1 MAG: 3-deoxy-8-phosphooctulonate synthase [Candidatus Eisenbacteria bacterium]